MKTLTRTLALALSLAPALAGCGGGDPRPGPANDPAAARALFDRASVAALRGDALTQDDLLLQLAVEHPDTRHGRAARARLDHGAITLAAAGIAAAVAIPAFMKYTRRTKTGEARMNVHKMHDGAISYYLYSRQGGQPGRFPPTVALTPESAPCVDGVERYTPGPDTWSHPTWEALNFAIDDPHHYRYAFISEGEGPGAHFTARAIGDLDCDGVLSTFERVGRVDEDGNVVSGAGLYVKDDLE